MGIFSLVEVKTGTLKIKPNNLVAAGTPQKSLVFVAVYRSISKST